MILSKKSVTTVLIEAVVVGICLILFGNLIEYFKNYIPNISGMKDKIEIYFIAGFVFHIVFEWTGINLWYAKEYCKIA
jgi:hypothetical protein|uniref:Uncharacterized protein n=1 Tax=viral metagenome TaxID=1070528 RepID=A0A6C0AMQ2_9ZZZZ